MSGWWEVERRMPHNDDYNERTFRRVSFKLNKMDKRKWKINFNLKQSWGGWCCWWMHAHTMASINGKVFLEHIQNAALERKCYFVTLKMWICSELPRLRPLALQSQGIFISIYGYTIFYFNPYKMANVISPLSSFSYRLNENEIIYLWCVCCHICDCPEEAMVAKWKKNEK